MWAAVTSTDVMRDRENVWQKLVLSCRRTWDKQASNARQLEQTRIYPANTTEGDSRQGSPTFVRVPRGKMVRDSCCCVRWARK